MANEGDIGERRCSGGFVEEVRQPCTAKAGGQKPGIGTVRGHGAQAVVAADDSHCRGDESGLGERDIEADTPGVHGNVLSEQAGAGVLLDAEEAEEGKESGAPVSGVGEVAEVEMGADVVQVLEGEATAGSGDIVVAVPVEDAGFDSIEGATSREVGVTHAHGVVGDGGHEAGETRDAVVLGVQDADAAELELRDGGRGVDAHGGADGAEDALPRFIGEASVEAEGVTGEEVDELT
jgi:hypothetical protein